jgi:hypothetical protein
MKKYNIDFGIEGIFAFIAKKNREVGLGSNSTL